ncbi:MAG: hypothetical protein ACMUIE_09775 [Thermoplasmatota archaeon]
MSSAGEEMYRKSLDETLWQVEESKKLGLSIVKAMNYINLSKEAQGYGNISLAKGLVSKAKDQLFNDLVDHAVSSIGGDQDVVVRMRIERLVKEARDRFAKGDIKGAYELLFEEGPEDENGAKGKVQVKEEMVPQLYSEALDHLQKVWLMMKQAETTGKDMTRAQNLIKKAKKMVANGDHEKVMALCKEIMDNIQSPEDRLREEVKETINEITRTMKALFPEEPRSPKERFFKKQIEELITLANQNLNLERPVEAINNSRKAKEILLRLEQEAIKGDIPKIIIDLRSSIDDIKASEVDVSYEEYLLKQVEETFWKGEYIQSRQIANKLESITTNAIVHIKMNQLSTRLRDLTITLKANTGKENYLEAKEYIEKAKMMLDQSAYDMAQQFLDKAENVLAA